jgi:hypothetical protein
MPRIRNWQDLHFYRPRRENGDEHIEAMFTAQIDWDLIMTRLPDMLRVAVSVKLGRVAPSTILRRLGTYPMDMEVLATLSPYQTEHINRFGTYLLNFQRTPPPLDLEFWMLYKRQVALSAWVCSPPEPSSGRANRCYNLS